MNYVKRIIEEVKEKYVNEPEFVEAVSEVFLSLEDVILENDKYEKNAILERLITPDRVISFRVPWTNDKGELKVNMGYRVEWSNAIGPYKGGLRFRDNVNLSVLKFLAFEQTFKNSLTGLLIGGGKGGSDFDPKGKSDNEIKNFCQSFMCELYKYIGIDKDVPAGDIGVSSKEIGYLFGQYKRLASSYNSSLTGKGLTYGGSLVRKEATGFGLVYITNEILKDNNLSLEGKRVICSGSGNVSIYTMQKAMEFGAKVVACSDSNGYIYSETGINLDTVKYLKEENRLRLKEYVKYHNDTTYVEGKKVFEVKCDICFPCATQNEIDYEDAINLVNNGCMGVFEGANMPSTSKAISVFKENNILYCPGKASNSGGVACSVLEMQQNQNFVLDSFEVVDAKLKNIMLTLFKNLKAICKKYNLGNDYQKAANILGFERVAEALISQGV